MTSRRSPAFDPFAAIEAVLQKEVTQIERRLDRAGLLGPHPTLRSYHRNARVAAGLVMAGACGVAAAVAMELAPLWLAGSGALAVSGLMGVLVSVGGIAGYRSAARKVITAIDGRHREVDPGQWAAIPKPAHGYGHLYVIQFATGVVKAGQTNDPTRRMNEHRRNSRAFNVPMTRVWISSPHAAYLTNEVQLLAAIAGDHDGDRAKREYFHHADFDAVVRIADGLAADGAPVPLA